MIRLNVRSRDGDEQIEFSPKAFVIAGWAGRDAAAVEAHIRELEEIGIARPSTVPIYYRVATTLLTTAPSVQMVGREASGEVEAVLFKHAGRLLVGVGSDHTDRKLETVGITLSKQLCAKPIAAEVWPWEEVAAHWDDLVLRSTIEENVTYQEGATATLRRPDDLLARYEGEYGALPDGGVMFCGTLPVTGGIRFADTMRLELIDSASDRALSHSYRVDVLPIVEAVA